MAGDELPSAAGAAVDPAIGYPQGHLGHLTETEQKSFEDFKAFLLEKGDYTAGPPPSHDDQTLMWIVEDAYKQFKDTENWRVATKLDALYDTIDLESYENCRILYPMWTGRRDRRGIPLYLFEIKHLDSKTISTYEKSFANDESLKAHTAGDTSDANFTSPKMLRLFTLYENLTRFVQPLCTEMPDRADAEKTPITLSTNIVDISGVSLRMFWNLKAHMQAAAQLATAHYPETLDRIFIIGAPGFFTTVWGWIKRWFDPVTVSKIFILSQAEVLPVLTSFIDPAHIPKQYGGQLDFQWKQQPNLDPAIKERAVWENGFTTFPTGPLFFRPLEGDEENRLECIAIGSEGGKERRVRVCTFPRSFRGVPASNQPVANGDGEVKGVKEAEYPPPPADGTVLSPLLSPPADSPRPNGNGTPATPATPASLTEGVQGIQNLRITDATADEKTAKVSASDAKPQTVGA